MNKLKKLLQAGWTIGAWATSHGYIMKASNRKTLIVTIAHNSLEDAINDLYKRCISDIL